MITTHNVKLMKRSFNETLEAADLMISAASPQEQQLADMRFREARSRLHSVLEDSAADLIQLAEGVMQ